MYKNYVFDLYGTLVDMNTDEEKKIFWKRISSKFRLYGVRYSYRRLRKQYIKLCKELENGLEEKLKCNHVEIPLEDVFKSLFMLKNKNPLENEVIEMMKYFRKESTQYIKLYDGVLDVLDELKKKGKKIYLLSNAQYYFTMPEIEELGIKDYFDGIVISSSEAYKKPNPKFYDILFTRYNLSKTESVMIGNDSLCDIEGAKLFGIDTFYINTNISPEYDKNKNVMSTYKSLNGSVRDYLNIVK